MKYFLILTFILSCSHVPPQRHLSSSEQDTFTNESFFRYSQSRLSQKSLRHDWQGVALCHQKNYQQGLQNLKIQFKIRHSDPSYWNQIALCHQLSGDLKKAYFFYRLSLQKGKSKGGYAPTLNNLAALLHKQDRYQESFDLLNQAKKLDPKSLTIQYNIAQLLLHFNQLDQSKVILDKLYLVNSRDPDILGDLTLIQTLKGKPVEAHKFFSSIEKDFYRYQNLALGLALAYFKQRQYAKAYQLIEDIEIKQNRELQRISEHLKQELSAKLDQQG